ncbi:MAG: NUDIX domain-containing protein [Candidatus Heimdallarchaeota archaeon]
MSYPNQMAAHFIGVGGVVMHDGNVLLVKLTYGPAQGKWLIPGGMVDPGETLGEAVKREIEEETGMDVEPVGILSVRSMVRTGDGLTDLYCIFLCELVDTLDRPPHANDGVEITEVAWFPLDRLESDDLVTGYTKKIVKAAQGQYFLVPGRQRTKDELRAGNLEKYEDYWLQDQIRKI